MNSYFIDLTKTIFHEFFHYYPKLDIIEDIDKIINPSYIELKKNPLKITEIIPNLIKLYEGNIIIYFRYRKKEKIMVIEKNERHLVIRIDLDKKGNTNQIKEAEICYLSKIEPLVNNFEITYFYTVSFDRIYQYLKYLLT